MLVAALCGALSCAGFVQPRPPALALSEPVAIRYESSRDGAITVDVHVWQREYAVPGDSVDQVRANLDVLRLGGPTGDFSAYTEWDLRWSLRFGEHGDSCGLEGASIEVDAVVTLPGLQDASALSRDALDGWQRYVAALKDHELTHVQNEVDGANLLRDELAGVEPAADCSALGKAIAELGEQQKEWIRQADTALDAETKHGALTGATFR